MVSICDLNIYIYHFLREIPKGNKINASTGTWTYVSFVKNELYHRVHTLIILNYI